MHLARLWPLIVVLFGGVVAAWKFLPSSLKDVLTEPLKDKVHGWFESRKHERDFFMLKAMGHGESSSIAGRTFTLAQIESKLTMFQIEFVLGRAIPLPAPAVTAELKMREKIRRLRKLQKWGIPDPQDDAPIREERIEQILQEMVHRGKLKYHPPDAYAVV